MGTLTDENEVKDDFTTVTEEKQAGNILSALKAKRQKAGTDRTCLLDIPGYGGLVAARYKKVDWDELRKIQEAADKIKHPKAQLAMHADTIAKATVELFVRDGGDLIPLRQVVAADAPVTYANAKALAEAFGFEIVPKSARQAVFMLFNDELAVTVHHNELAEWMADADRQSDEDFLGE